MLALVTLILVSEFNSLMVTGIIMTTVVLSLIGVLMGLLVWGLPFGIIMTGIGVISLAGIVVNNGIVLLDYTRQLERRGLDVVSATVEAGVTRLRPVLLSAVTNFVGLVPMALGISFDFHTFAWSTKSSSSQWWNNMAVVMIFGLSFGTILTLVVVPSLYVMVSRIAARLGLRRPVEADSRIEAHRTRPDDVALLPGALSGSRRHARRRGYSTCTTFRFLSAFRAASLRRSYRRRLPRTLTKSKCGVESSLAVR